MRTSDPTLPELLDEPIVRLTMAADRVDVGELRFLLELTARRQQPAGQRPGRRRDDAAGRREEGRPAWIR